jgi:branched-chain amino acid transport system permease protein
MTEFVQQVVDGLGRGGTYALLALGLGLVFGVMHLVNFAHGELITVGAYVAYRLVTDGFDWWLVAPAMVLAAVVTAVATERVAFRRVRGASEFTLLLTSFGAAIVIQTLFRMYVSAKPRQFSTPGWRFDTVEVFGISLEVYDLVTLAVTLVTLLGLLWLLRRTTFGIALRASAEDFDAARLMGVRANRTISGAFALSGVLAGIAAVLIVIRTGQAEPSMGLDPLLKGVVAAIIGGLGSLGGAVLGGFALGLTEVAFRAWLPPELSGLTDGAVFFAIALLFIFRPQGLVSVRRAERV